MHSNFLKAPFIFVLLLILNACVGTGTKSIAEAEAMARNGSNAPKIFISRQNQISSRSALTTVKLNGKVIGKVGAGEILVGDGRIGENKLEIYVDGIQGIGWNKPVKNFSVNSNAPMFYQVSIGISNATFGLPNNNAIIQHRLNLRQISGAHFNASNK